MTLLTTGQSITPPAGVAQVSLDTSIFLSSSWTGTAVGAANEVAVLAALQSIAASLIRLADILDHAAEELEDQGT